MIDRTSFLTPERQDILFENIISVLYFAMPLFLIWMAFEYGGLFISMIRKAFSRIDEKDDDDYEYDED